MSGPAQWQMNSAITNASYHLRSVDHIVEGDYVMILVGTCGHNLDVIGKHAYRTLTNVGVDVTAKRKRCFQCPKEDAR